MRQEIQLEQSLLFDLKQIPEKVYNKTLSEEQRSRLASGRQTGLIKDIFVEEGKPPVDAKISASKGKDGELVLTYDYAEKIFKMPTAILGMKLTPDQKDKLFNGDLLTVKYKGEDMFVGVDKELNKITVKSTNQIGIPSEISDYKLTDVDKYYLAQGKKTDIHLFKTKEDNFFTANFKMTEDGKGVEFSNIKFVDKENAPELKEKYNVDRKIIDESYMLPPVRISQFVSDNVVSIDNRPAEYVKKIVTSPLERDHTKSINDKVVIDAEILSGSNLEKQSRRPIVEYKNVATTDTGFTIEATEYFAPYKLKGVTLSEEQRKSIANGDKTLVQGMNINNKPTDAYVQIKENGNGFDWDFKSAKNQSLNKTLTKSKGDDNKIER